MPGRSSTTVLVARALRYDVAGQLAVQVAAFGTSVVLARSLGPQGFGQLALVLAVASTTALLANLGGTEVATRFVPEMKARGQLRGVFGLAWPLMAARLAASAAVAGVIIGLRGPVGEAIGLDRSFSLALAAMASAHALLAGFQGPAQVLLVNLDRQRLLNGVATVSNAAGFAAMLTLAALGRLTLELAVAVTVATLAARVAVYVSAAARAAGRQSDASLDAASAEYAAALRRRMFRYSGVMFLIAVGGFLLQTRSDAYLVGAVLGAQAVAFYHLADGFTRTAFTLPAPRLTGFLMTGLLTEAYVSSGLEPVRRRFRQMARMQFLVNVPIGFGGAVLAERIVEAVYGPEYAAAAGLLALFFLLQMPLYWIGAISGVLVAVEKPQWFLWTKAVSVATIPLAIWWLNLWGVYGALYATSLGTAAVAALEFVAARRYSGISFPAVDVARYMVAGGVMAAAVAALEAVIAGPAWLVLAVTVPAGAVTYGAALLLVRALSAEDIAALRALLPSSAALRRWRVRSA
jgi:O-antigen/teichoic acid export membrane protein